MNSLGLILLTISILLFAPWAAYKISQAIKQEQELQREESLTNEETTK